MSEPTPSFEAMADAAIAGLDNPTPTPTPTPTPAPTLEPTPAPTPAPESVPTPTPTPEPDADPKLDPVIESLFGKVEGEPAPTPPAEPEPGDKPPGDKNTPGAQKAWAELRQDRKWRKDNEPEFEKLKIKVAELEKKTSGEDPQLAQVKAQAEHAMNLLRIRDVESTPEFAENITKPIQKMEEVAAGIAKKHELSVVKVLSAMRETDADRQSELLADITEGLNDRDKSRIFSMTDQYAELTAKGKYLKENAAIALEALNKDRVAKGQKRFEAIKKARADALGAVATDFKKNVFLFQPIEGQDAWNAGIAEIDQLANKIEPETLHPVARAKLIYQGLALPRAMELLQKVAEENKSLRAAQAKYRKAIPGAGAPNPDPTPGPGDVSGKGFLEAMESRLHNK